MFFFSSEVKLKWFFFLQYQLSYWINVFYKGISMKYKDK